MIDDLDDLDEFWSGAAERLEGLALHPSHLWVRYSEADCFDGLHAPMKCYRCNVDPLPRVCYHALQRGDTRQTWVNGKRAEDQINPAALAPCPAV